MKSFRKSITSITAAGVWVTISEFLRNEVLLKSLWVDHYSSRGLTFPSEPVNGVVWMLWSFCYAGVLFVISRRFSLLQTSLLGWFAGFVLMWLVIGNMNVLPGGVLVFAVPLSLLEAFVASFLLLRIAPPEKPVS